MRNRDDETKKRERRTAGPALDDVVRIKAKLAEATEKLNKALEEKAKLEKQLEAANAAIGARNDAQDPNRQYPGLGGKSIIDRIADHFVEHPETSFSPSEVMLYLKIPTGNIDAVRASFKRLASPARRVLKHDGYAKYRLNPEHEET